ncbi:MAG: hypothetical protein K2L01_04345 [Rikenellaceae bacterium]|nr:hypothetical protein [Rikenellaceae bacterium]
MKTRKPFYKRRRNTFSAIHYSFPSEQLRGTMFDCRAETILKYAKLYNDYTQLNEEIRSRYPEVADHITRKFYYKIISSRNNLSYNYVVSIISMVSANRDLLDKAVDEAMVYIAHKKLDLL